MVKIPTVTMAGPGGKVVVNASDKALYESKGYKATGEGSESVSIRGGGGVDWSKYKKGQLVEFCEQSELNSDGTKDELIARLEKDGVTIDEDEE